MTPTRPPEPTTPQGEPTLMNQSRETRAMAALVKELVVQFPEVPSATVLATVTTAHQRFDGSPIRDYVPILVGRVARDRLRGTNQGF